MSNPFRRNIDDLNPSTGPGSRPQSAENNQELPEGSMQQGHDVKDEKSLSIKQHHPKVQTTLTNHEVSTDGQLDSEQSQKQLIQPIHKIPKKAEGEERALLEQWFEKSSSIDQEILQGLTNEKERKRYSILLTSLSSPPSKVKNSEQDAQNFQKIEPDQFSGVKKQTVREKSDSQKNSFAIEPQFQLSNSQAQEAASQEKADCENLRVSEFEVLNVESGTKKTVKKGEVDASVNLLVGKSLFQVLNSKSPEASQKSQKKVEEPSSSEKDLKSPSNKQFKSPQPQEGWSNWKGVLYPSSSKRSNQKINDQPVPLSENSQTYLDDQKKSIRLANRLLEESFKKSAISKEDAEKQGEEGGSERLELEEIESLNPQDNNKLEIEYCREDEEREIAQKQSRGQQLGNVCSQNCLDEEGKEAEHFNPFSPASNNASFSNHSHLSNSSRKRINHHIDTMQVPELSVLQVVHSNGQAKAERRDSFNSSGSRHSRSASTCRKSYEDLSEINMYKIDESEQEVDPQERSQHKNARTKYKSDFIVYGGSEGNTDRSERSLFRSDVVVPKSGLRPYSERIESHFDRLSEDLNVIRSQGCQGKSLEQVKGVQNLENDLLSRKITELDEINSEQSGFNQELDPKNIDSLKTEKDSVISRLDIPPESGLEHEVYDGIEVSKLPDRQPSNPMQLQEDRKQGAFEIQFEKAEEAQVSGNIQPVKSRQPYPIEQVQNAQKVLEKRQIRNTGNQKKDEPYPECNLQVSGNGDLVKLSQPKTTEGTPQFQDLSIQNVPDTSIKGAQCLQPRIKREEKIVKQQRSQQVSDSLYNWHAQENSSAQMQQQQQTLRPELTFKNNVLQSSIIIGSCNPKKESTRQPAESIKRRKSETLRLQRQVFSIQQDSSLPKIIKLQNQEFSKMIEVSKKIIQNRGYLSDYELKEFETAFLRHGRSHGGTFNPENDVGVRLSRDGIFMHAWIISCVEANKRKDGNILFYEFFLFNQVSTLENRQEGSEVLQTNSTYFAQQKAKINLKMDEHYQRIFRNSKGQTVTDSKGCQYSPKKSNQVPSDFNHAAENQSLSSGGRTETIESNRADSPKQNLIKRQLSSVESPIRILEAERQEELWVDIEKEQTQTVPEQNKTTNKRRKKATTRKKPNKKNQSRQKLPVIRQSQDQKVASQTKDDNVDHQSADKFNAVSCRTRSGASKLSSGPRPDNQSEGDGSDSSQKAQEGQEEQKTGADEETAGQESHRQKQTKRDHKLTSKNLNPSKNQTGRQNNLVGKNKQSLNRKGGSSKVVSFEVEQSEQEGNTMSMNQAPNLKAKVPRSRSKPIRAQNRQSKNTSNRGKSKK